MADTHPPEALEPTATERRIVVGVDGSSGSLQALEWAAHEARQRGTVLEILVAWTLPAASMYAFTPDVAGIAGAMQEIANQAAQRSAEVEPEVVVRTEVKEIPPAEALVDASQGAEMLVVGSRGYGGFRGLLLGSVSQHCAHHAHCPIVIVRPRPPASPA